MTVSNLQELSQKLYGYRTAMKNLFGDRYLSVLKPYMETVNNFAINMKVDQLQAAIRLCKNSEDPHLTIAIMAACVEILDPSSPPNPQDQRAASAAQMHPVVGRTLCSFHKFDEPATHMVHGSPACLECAYQQTATPDPL